MLNFVNCSIAIASLALAPQQLSLERLGGAGRTPPDLAPKKGQGGLAPRRSGSSSRTQSPSVAATAFDLACNGIVRTLTVTINTAEPYSYTYRIDLGKKQYCDEECRYVRTLAEIQPGVLTLNKEDKVTAGEEYHASDQIDRVTGKHSKLVRAQVPGRSETGIIKSWQGTCERKPFSGFSPPPTKF
jgi:hypothetical protein